METQTWLVIIGALIAFLQTIILFVLVGFRTSIKELWGKIDEVNSRCLTHESRLGRLEGKSCKEKG